MVHVHGVQGSTDTEMTVMPGAYEERPYAVDAPAMDSCGGLTSPGGRPAANPARMAVRLLLLLYLAESFVTLSSIWCLLVEYILNLVDLLSAPHARDGHLQRARHAVQPVQES